MKLKTKFYKAGAYIKQYWLLYLFLVPGILQMVLFKYLPMGGLLIAVKDYSITKGVGASPWVGLFNFATLFSSSSFLEVFRNSLINSFLLFIWAFPAPVILSILLNEMQCVSYKKAMQTILYLPHFISWVVVASIAMSILGTSAGSVINDILARLGKPKISFLSDPKYFRTVLVGTSIWKNSGWGTVVYLAALAGIDPALYEAAVVDGANRLQRIYHITLPCILNTIVVMLILNIGNLMTNNFEQTWLLRNNLNKSVSEVLETYSYKIGLQENKFSYSAAIGMFQSVVGCVLLLTSNYVSKKTGGNGLW